MKGRINIEANGEVFTLRVGTLALSRIEEEFKRPAMEVFEGLNEENKAIFTDLIRVAGIVIEGEERSKAECAEIIDAVGVPAFLEAVVKSIHASFPPADARDVGNGVEAKKGP